MLRRQILSLLAVSISITAGCSLRGGTVSLAVQNFSPTDAEFDIRLTRDGSVAYATAVMVPAGEKRHLDSVAEGGRYELVLSADSVGEATRPITMNECDEQDVSIAILPETGLDIQSKQC